MSFTCLVEKQANLLLVWHVRSRRVCPKFHLLAVEVIEEDVVLPLAFWNLDIGLLFYSILVPVRLIIRKILQFLFIENAVVIVNVLIQKTAAPIRRAHNELSHTPHHA